MKAQGLPISTIIIAALGILVLIVLAAIFSGQIGKFGRAASSCNNDCVSPTDLTSAKALGNDAASKLCSDRNEKVLYGLYAAPGQTGDPSTWQYCSACCLPIGAG